MPTDKPNPGSNNALSQGCLCPIMDNGHGRGYMGGAKNKDGEVMFIISGNCPLHSDREIEDAN